MKKTQSKPTGVVFELARAIPQGLLTRAVADALAEDLGLVGDITTDATIPASATAIGHFVARKPGVIAGLAVAAETFRSLDRDLVFVPKTKDGQAVERGQVVAHISGSARAILTGERVALNFMGRMSGIATLTNLYVSAVAGLPTRIVDTRKTTPGLRAFEKYAVRCGGGTNHRVGLFDAILIKDNHIVAAGGIAAAITAARARVGHLVKIEVEVDTLAQLEEVLAHKVDVVLLDNMTPVQLREAVARVNGAMLTEASGGVSLESVRAIAETGVDLISIGALTHSASVLDIGLDFTG
jgi:nicotinate-nucleotide pyrophosphorylase (carboxylating)